ncbi:hypothetical protein CQ018_16030 [Arthrobacter sp. MYb227]|uniref:hypothetical protein n=1 Tax=Arthrobacter sp. MYb227 TaxID=1848601 RepID=UPI000CFB1959|nr:hypothetical protein [Arthrobacter sp. MYb227]PQZ89054.1 hypothetical protein CQ018_16030 [Arthrobacter sp. MYb227]
MSDLDDETVKTRELTSGRSPAAIVLAVLVIVLCGYALFEASLKALGQEPLIATPETWWRWISTLPGESNLYALAAAGAVLTMLGLTFFIHGVRTGRLAKHSMQCEEAVLILDDQVLAAALARRTQVDAAVGQGQVLVIINRDRIEVQIRPTSGTPLSDDTVIAALENELEINSVVPLPKIKVKISANGVIGQ